MKKLVLLMTMISALVANTSFANQITHGNSEFKSQFEDKNIFVRNMLDHFCLKIAQRLNSEVAIKNLSDDELMDAFITCAAPVNFRRAVQISTLSIAGASFAMPFAITVKYFLNTSHIIGEKALKVLSSALRQNFKNDLFMGVFTTTPVLLTGFAFSMGLQDLELVTKTFEVLKAELLERGFTLEELMGVPEYDENYGIAP